MRDNLGLEPEKTVNVHPFHSRAITSQRLPEGHPLSCLALPFFHVIVLAVFQFYSSNCCSSSVICWASSGLP
jgi:hypothetical protein